MSEAFHRLLEQRDGFEAPSIVLDILHVMLNRRLAQLQGDVAELTVLLLVADAQTNDTTSEYSEV